jgi:hypothetical protein
MQPSSLGWWRSNPSVATIDTTACGDPGVSVRVERFPSGESKVTLNISRMLDGIQGGFSKLPVQDLRGFTQKGKPRKIRRAGEAKTSTFLQRFENTEPKWSGPAEAEFGLQIASEWEEDPKSNLVFCQVSVFGGWDPLFEGDFNMLLYGVPIPPKLRGYLTAGVYLGFKGNISAGAKAKLKSYPAPTSRIEVENSEGLITGSIAISISADFFVISSDCIQAKASGSVAMKAEGAFGFNDAGDFQCAPDFRFGQFSAAVWIRMCWGLFECERKWDIWEGYKITPKPVVFRELS